MPSYGVVPFHIEYYERIIRHEKFVTVRRSRHAFTNQKAVGTFQTYDRTKAAAGDILLEWPGPIGPMPGWKAAFFWFAAAGHKSPAEFLEMWETLYRERFDPLADVFVHPFRYLGPLGTSVTGPK